MSIFPRFGTFVTSKDLRSDRPKVTLIIHGDDDPIPASTARKVHESIQDSKYVEIKECGHFPYVEQPDLYFESLVDFLNDAEIGLAE